MDRTARIAFQAKARSARVVGVRDVPADQPPAGRVVTAGLDTFARLDDRVDAVDRLGRARHRRSARNSTGSGAASSGSSSSRMFFFWLSSAYASSSKDGAATTSVKISASCWAIA